MTRFKCEDFELELPARSYAQPRVAGAPKVPGSPYDAAFGGQKPAFPGEQS